MPAVARVFVVGSFFGLYGRVESISVGLTAGHNSVKIGEWVG